MTPTRYGLIGAGMMGQEHIRNILLLPDTEIAAIVEPDPAMRDAALALAGSRARVFDDAAALAAAGGCDAVVVCTPNDLHLDALRTLRPAGLPILCEKPLATNAADCRDLIGLYEGGPPVWVAMEYRYMPPVALLLEALAAGRAGSPRMMSIREHRFPFLQKVGNWNRSQRRTGGTMVEKCCHFFDLMRLALGRNPVRIYASGGADVNHRDEFALPQRPEMIDNAFVVVDFDGGLRAMLDFCMFAEGAQWQETVTVTGDAARLDAYVPGPARFAPGGVERSAEFAVSSRADKIERRQSVPVDPRVLEAGDHHGSTFFQHERFLAMVRGGGAPEVTLEDGYWSVLMGEAAETSARLGQPVAFDAQGDMVAA